MHMSRTHRLLSSTGLSRFARLALLSLATLAPAAHAQNLPTGGNVTAGSATITNGAGSVTINQSSQAAAINWDSFNIGQGNNVTFVQPGSNALALNRVIGADPSQI